MDERIAAGGVGYVWRATDLLLERPVAVKVLRPEYSDHPETIDRFRKEARHSGAISNAHVARLYDYGPAGPGGSPYLVMEFIDGPSLADLLVVDPIEPVRALDIVSQAADGLAAAHKAGLVHRDVKPGNILISKEGQVKVTDFGIAHAAGQVPVTAPGLVMGTTHYIAPERIAGHQGTAASDVYALGIVLHECLTGVPPHDGTPAEVMAAHLYLPLPPLPSGTPPELEDLVARLTVKDPARRISDAGELSDLAATLRDSLSGAIWTATPPPNGAGGPLAYVADEWNGPVHVPPPTRPFPVSRPKPRRRRKGRVIALAAAVVAGAGLATLLASGAFHGAPATTRVPAASPTTSSPAPTQTPAPGASGPAGAAGTGRSGLTDPGGATNPWHAGQPGHGAGGSRLGHRGEPSLLFSRPK